MTAITSAPDEGSMREAYFTGQLTVSHDIKQSKQGASISSMLFNH